MQKYNTSVPVVCTTQSNNITFMPSLNLSTSSQQQQQVMSNFDLNNMTVNESIYLDSSLTSSNAGGMNDQLMLNINNDSVMSMNQTSPKSSRKASQS